MTKVKIIKQNQKMRRKISGHLTLKRQDCIQKFLSEKLPIMVWDPDLDPEQDGTETLSEVETGTGINSFGSTIPYC
jgi:hypothetical protein